MILRALTFESRKIWDGRTSFVDFVVPLFSFLFQFSLSCPDPQDNARSLIFSGRKSRDRRSSLYERANAREKEKKKDCRRGWGATETGVIVEREVQRVRVTEIGRPGRFAYLTGGIIDRYLTYPLLTSRAWRSLLWYSSRQQ